MQIRRLEPRDAPAFRDLRLRGLREFPQAFTSSYEEEQSVPLETSEQRLGSQGRRFWGAFADGELCGIVGIECERRAKNRHKATVVAMHVKREQMGRGVGAALMRALIEDARASGLELLVLTVTQGQGSARRLYERFGFRSFGSEPRAIKVGGRAYAKDHMYLELS